MCHKVLLDSVQPFSCHVSKIPGMGDRSSASNVDLSQRDFRATMYYGYFQGTSLQECFQIIKQRFWRSVTVKNQVKQTIHARRERVGRRRLLWSNGDDCYSRKRSVGRRRLLWSNGDECYSRKRPVGRRRLLCLTATTVSPENVQLEDNCCDLTATTVTPETSSWKTTTVVV